MIILRRTNIEEILFCADDSWDENTITISHAGDLFTVNCSCNPDREYGFLSEDGNYDLMKESITDIISHRKDTDELMGELTEMFRQKFGDVWVA